MYNTQLETAFSRELETRFKKGNISAKITMLIIYISNPNCDSGSLRSNLSFHNEYDILEIL